MVPIWYAGSANCGERKLAGGFPGESQRYRGQYAALRRINRTVLPLVEQGQLKAGDSVLVQGTGGVALFALQIAKAQGATVYVTSSSDAKLDRAKALGADFVINRHQGDWVEQALSLSRGRGIDHVVDTVGGGNVAHSVAAVAPGGRVSLIGVLEGTEIGVPAVPMLMKSAVIQGIGVGHRRALTDLVRAVDATHLKPVIDSTGRWNSYPKRWLTGEWPIR